MKHLFVNWHNIHDPFAVVAHKENSLKWPDLSSLRVLIACSISCHTWPLHLLGFLQLQLKTKVFVTYWTSGHGIEQIRF